MAMEVYCPTSPVESMVVVAHATPLEDSTTLALSPVPLTSVCEKATPERLNPVLVAPSFVCNRVLVLVAAVTSVPTLVVASFE